MGNAEAKGHFKGTVQAPYAGAGTAAESTPAQYRHFMMIKVITQVVNPCILGGQMPRDAVGGQFDTVPVYKMMRKLMMSRFVEHVINGPQTQW